MNGERCPNQNHSKMNVVVRYCAACGEVVNKNISKGRCTEALHAYKRKDRNHYCTHCGKDLKAKS